MPPGGELVFRTKYTDKGFEEPVPEFLWIEGHGTGEDFKAVATNVANSARLLASILSVAGNAAIAPPEVELVFENTPGVSERTFFQIALPPEPPILAVSGRTLPANATSEFLQALGTSPHVARLIRAVGQYSTALLNWAPGAEMVCVGHLFMGMEALKSVALAEHLRSTGATEEGAGVVWGFDPSRHQKLRDFLLSEARRRLLFEDNSDCHRKTKAASDALEHGHMDFGVIRRIASEVVLDAAHYLRKAIIQYSGLSAQTRDALINQSGPPRGPLRIMRYFYGALLGESETLAASGQTYPICEWKAKLKRVFKNKDGKYSTELDENWTVRIADNLQLRRDRYEIWDGSTIVKRGAPPGPPPTDVKIE